MIFILSPAYASSTETLSRPHIPDYTTAAADFTHFSIPEFKDLEASDAVSNRFWRYGRQPVFAACSAADLAT
jgi:hypothetical protein